VLPTRDTDTTAYVVHFSIADGVALQKQRKGARERLAPNPPECKRWLSVVEEDPRGVSRSSGPMVDRSHSVLAPRGRW
jgi:hypothetical protein